MEINVMVIGGKKVGKTTLISSIVENAFITEHNESIGMDTKVVKINEVPIKVQYL